jgi:hypothetical protein
MSPLPRPIQHGRVSASWPRGMTSPLGKDLVMKLVIRLGLLALAALGAKTLYERARPHIEAARGTTQRVVDSTLEPTFRGAATGFTHTSALATDVDADAFV